MSQDRSLDEFVDRADTADTKAERASENEDHDHGPRDATVEVTFAWSQTGASCATCGERVERRWQSDHGLVCEACKTW